MITAFIKSSCFQDSVSLMIISKKLSEMDSVNHVSVMMGTPSNKEMFRTTGLWHKIFETATANDICIAIDTLSEGVLEEVSTKLDIELTNISSSLRGKMLPIVRSWSRAKKLLPDANLALISVAGEYAAETAHKALDLDLNVMIFSDNIPASQERFLKEKARDKGLIVMGPDCGTAYISGIPLAFANKMPEGPIGIIGASGTGIQELCSQIALLGGGITHAIGLGGRDLSEDVGGISAKIALDMLDNDNDTKVIVFVSKPPAPSIRKDIIEKMQTLSKPVVALFLGDKLKNNKIGNVYLPYTLDETARTANQLVNALTFISLLGHSLKDQKVRGLYTGGTLAAEAGMLVAEIFNLKVSSTHENGVMLNDRGHLIIDLGDDYYTVGRPHPMIDPSTRNDQIIALKDQDFGVLLVDVVLGFGSHADPAGAVVDAVKELNENSNSSFAVIATVTGTSGDPQNRAEQILKLEDAGIKVANSVSEAVVFSSMLTSLSIPKESNSVPHYLLQQPKIINIGLAGFAEDLLTCNATAIHYRWSPVAGGNAHMAELLNKLS